MRSAPSSVFLQAETEANTVDDNPLVDVAHHRVLHGGNFQGQYIGTGMDALRYHIALLTKHLDVQIALLVTPEMSNGLPPSLVGDRDPGSGIKLGLKALQICGNSIMPRLLHLGAPIAHLFPTHAEQYNQNINSQGFNSANLAWESVRLLRTYLSVALIFAVQSVELRAFVGEGHYDGRAYLSPACRPLYDAFYEVVGQEQASSRPFVGKNREQDFGDLVATLEADLSSVGGKLLRSVDDA
jgi:phenylalanine ammonia-lyase